MLYFYIFNNEGVDVIMIFFECFTLLTLNNRYLWSNGDVFRIQTGGLTMQISALETPWVIYAWDLSDFILANFLMIV